MKRLLDDGTYREVDPATWGTVTPMQRARRLDDTQEFPAMGVEPDHSAQMVGWVLLAVCCAAGAASSGFAVWLVMR